MNREDLNSISNRKNAVLDMKEASELLTPVGNSVKIVSIFEQKENTSVNGNWFFAINGYRTWSDATTRATQNNDGRITYTMSMSYNLRDNYRWYVIDEDGNVNAESVLHMLHLAGWAREFRVEGMEVIPIQTWTN